MIWHARKRARGCLESGALEAFFGEIRSAYRRLAKESHPDVTGNDAEAAQRFQAIQAAYEVLRKAEERRAALSP